jgi:chromosome segregation protein
MRLESIVLHGFKSFAEKTSIRILPGITGIVGPNGCGKSNVSEAIRWALGEQSVKSLRGARMEDLIFHGSASRKAVGLAEVELTFANDGTLAVPWSEVAVSRRLYRTGDSEYLLNRNACRLRDILDLLAGTGANPRAYSVMDQDKLNHVLTAKPYERRIFIEEAAGIARYKQQRNETQGKLEATRQNLLRVRDVMDEVRRQLGSLERQAKRAQQYKVLHGEKQVLARVLVAADYAALTAEGARLQAELDRLGDGERELRVRQSALAAREATQRVAQEGVAHRLGDLRQSVQKVQGELERLVERREQMGIQIRELAEEEERLAAEARVAQERIASIASDRSAAGAALGDAQALATARNAAAREQEARLEQCRAALAAERDRLEALRLEQVRVAAEQTDLTRSTGELRERQAQGERRRAKLDQELLLVRAELERLTAQRGALASAHERAVAALATVLAERNEIEALLADREPRLGEAQGRLGEARVARAARRSSLEALEQLERAREGYGAGVRAMFTEAGAPRLSGVVGTVADLLDVPAGLDTAVAAVLGERLEWIVVERFQQAREAVALLAGERAGAATFIPIETLPAPGALPGDEDGVRWAARLVRTESAPLLHYLLGRVAIVDDLDNAERLWRRNGVVATYVTRTGEVLSPVGRLRGGRAAGEAGPAPEHSLLQRKRARRELAAELARLERELAQAQTVALELDAEVTQLRQRVPTLAQAIHAGDATRLAGEKDVEQADRDRERLERHLGTLRVELAQVAADQADTKGLFEGLQARVALARQADESHQAVMATLRAAIERAQTEETGAVTELTTTQVEAASAAERVEALRRELGRLDELGAELAGRVDQGQVRQQQIGDRRAWLGLERERTDAAAREVAVDRDRLEAEERTLTAQHDALVAELRSIDAEARVLQGELGRLAAAAHAIELSATEGRVRREELEQEARRAYEVASPEALLALHDPARDLSVARTRLTELEEKLGAMGAVNLVADEEYRELDERLAFLRTQHDDLVASMKDLEKALRGVTRSAQERFRQAFEDINVRFTEIFERLFEGGRAELRLVESEEGEDPLESGVELMAQPRGKRLQAVTLMSGGERALTGLALLFAIFYYRPSPFCVLDEVDAPLDDANIHRFLRVLRELTARTQFLVITHNRKTMEAADVLYGVTMEEPGLSKLVSVTLLPQPA